MLNIDGSIGEGGGQILRSALSLSMITGKPFTLFNIRARRSVPGLRPQHLAAIRLAGRISSAVISGDEIGSCELEFAPAKVKSGAYAYDIKTAGSTSLLLQSVVMPLALQSTRSTLVLQGGTHVPFSPSYHFLKEIWLPVLSSCGLDCELEIQRAGYYPAGGGQIYIRLKPSRISQPIRILNRGNLRQIRGVVGISNLDMGIARRLKYQVLRRIEPVIRDVKIKIVELPSPHPGVFVFLNAEFEFSKFGFCGLGKKGKRSELIADETVDKLLQTIDKTGAIDTHLSDQILLPLAVCDQGSEFSTPEITRHLMTNAEVLSKFFSVTIKINGMIGEPGTVHILPG